MSLEKYLLAVIPPKNIANFVDAYRAKYAKKNLNISPYITVYPPFYWPDSETVIISRLNKIFSMISPFCVKLTSVNYFIGKNNVAYFSPDSKSSVLLKKLFIFSQEHLSKLTSYVWPEYPTDPNTFIPHMTIAERVPDHEFAEMKRDFDLLSINQQFEVKSIFLLKKQFDFWQPISEIIVPNTLLY